MDRLLQSTKYKMEVCSIVIVPMADTTELLQVYSELEVCLYNEKCVFPGIAELCISFRALPEAERMTTLRSMLLALAAPRGEAKLLTNNVRKWKKKSNDACLLLLQMVLRIALCDTLCEEKIYAGMYLQRC